MRLYLLEYSRNPETGTPIPGYLVMADDGTNVLVDTGFAEEFIGNVRPDPPWWRVDEEGYVVNQLAQIGLAPSDVRILVATHLDTDHSGAHDRFPGAEIVVQRAQYETAKGGDDPRYAINRAHWDAPGLRYRVVDGDTALLPGIELIESSGHVPGHQSVLVRLPETGPVLLTIDAIPRAAQTDPGARTVSPFDLDEAATRASTRKLVDLARQEGVTLVIYGHDAQQWRTLRHAPDYYA